MVTPNTLWLTGGENPDLIGTSEYVKLTDDALVTFEGPKLLLNIFSE